MENVWTAGGELLKTESGYTYTFAIADILNVADPYPTDSVNNGGMIAWDEDKLHRIVMAYGDQELGFTYVYQWIPGTPSDQTVSRNVIEEETCSNCHMALGIAPLITTSRFVRPATMTVILVPPHVVAHWPPSCISITEMCMPLAQVQAIRQPTNSQSIAMARWLRTSMDW